MAEYYQIITKKKLFFLNKIELLLVSLLKRIINLYQIIFSPIFGYHKCRFVPSCSCYMIESLNKKGLLKGLLFGSLRILKCHPFYKGNWFDPVK
jgi:putative membrane protein insertion efficiency factor